MRDHSALLNYTNKLVNLKSRYTDGFYYLTVNDLDELDKEKFASEILKFDPEAAASALGADNDAWENMRSGLAEYLSKSSDQERAEDFQSTIKKSVIHYLENSMEELIDESLRDYNFEANISFDPFVEYGVNRSNFA